MRINSIHDKEFGEFGEIITGYDFTGLIKTLRRETPVPADGVTYVPSCEALESLPVARELQNGLYGGLPVEIGYCNGVNTKLNCLEYHRGSELNVAADDIVLLLARRSDLSSDFSMDAEQVEAFRVPAGSAVLLYETSLHYAPARPDGSFQVAIVLPRGTNTEKPDIKVKFAEDKLLWANNKWLLAHEDAAEARDGAWIGITGANIDVTELG